MGSINHTSTCCLHNLDFVRRSRDFSIVAVHAATHDPAKLPTKRQNMSSCQPFMHISIAIYLRKPCRKKSTASKWKNKWISNRLCVDDEKENGCHSHPCTLYCTISFCMVMHVTKGFWYQQWFEEHLWRCRTRFPPDIFNGFLILYLL